jgi:hypothetical protein
MVDYVLSHELLPRLQQSMVLWRFWRRDAPTLAPAAHVPVTKPFVHLQDMSRSGFQRLFHDLYSSTTNVISIKSLKQL